MNKRKIVTILATVSLYASLLVGGTLAYFSDEDSAINTFEVGDVDIKLEEPSWQQEVGGNILVPGVEYPKDPTITVESTSQPSYVFLEIEINKHREFINLMGANYAAVVNQDNDPSNDVIFNGQTYFEEFITALENKEQFAINTVDMWLRGIQYEQWEIVDTQYVEEGRLVLAYIGDGTPEGALCYAEDQIVFMNSFKMPSTVTKEMIEAELYNANMESQEKLFNISFRALAIQAEGFYSIDSDINEIMSNAYKGLKRS